ncbi:hypothetical protein Csa_006137 [Cucumis sativus]|uniref:Uncharacterized protein n=1 Tax=Cucumis sativus TaxID=3659 RepID=A0A0A0LJP6_CUCSA|nr:hypothetical protein Csa_006137 [Cucumis sativus]
MQSVILPPNSTLLSTKHQETERPDTETQNTPETASSNRRPMCRTNTAQLNKNPQLNQPLTAQNSRLNPLLNHGQDCCRTCHKDAGRTPLKSSSPPNAGTHQLDNSLELTANAVNGAPPLSLFCVLYDLKRKVKDLQKKNAINA